MDSLAAGLMGMQQGKLQFEVGVRVAAKAMDVARDQGDAMVGMVTAASKVMQAGQKSLEKGIEGALKSLDVYA
ncbi:MAG: YjfB family protein [Planctomycetes bacterium]|nr:YjfB family protein [Planctomycetota bacterium]